MEFFCGPCGCRKTALSLPGDRRWPALSATLTLVDGITLDPEGNIYLSHRSQNRIRKIDRNGIITTVAGTRHKGYLHDRLEVNLIVHNFP